MSWLSANHYQVTQYFAASLEPYHKIPYNVTYNSKSDQESNES